MILTALLFYFGWARTKREAAHLGYDVTIYEMSLQDFLLKGVPALFMLLMVVGVVGLAAVFADRRIVRPLFKGTRRRAVRRRVATALIHSWIGWVVVVVVLGAVGAGDAVPFCVAAALGGALYGLSLRGAAPVPAVVRGLLAVLLAFSVVWTIERTVGWYGAATAEVVTANPQDLAAVTVFSAKDLRISAPGVRATPLDGAGSAYTMRYDGLMLLHRAGDRLILIPADWDPVRSHVIVLRDDDGVRFEFSRPR